MVDGMIFVHQIDLNMFWIFGADAFLKESNWYSHILQQWTDIVSDRYDEIFVKYL